MYGNAKTVDEAKKIYHQLAMKYHPDNADTGDANVFKQVCDYFRMACVALGDPSKIMKDVEQWFKHGRTKRKVVYKTSYKVGGCDVLYGDTDLAILFDDGMQDLNDNYLKTVADMQLPKDIDLKACMPQVADKFGKLIVLHKTPEVVCLNDVVEMADRGKIEWSDRARHATWIMNRLYLWGCIFASQDKVFMGFDAKNVFISPQYHTVLPLLGWQFTVNKDEKMLGATMTVANLLDSKTKQDKLAKSYIDTESIKEIGRRVFNGCSWKELDDFLNEAGSEDVEKDWERFTGIFLDKFKKRKFIAWDFDYNTFYNALREGE